MTDAWGYKTLAQHVWLKWFHRSSFLAQENLTLKNLSWLFQALGDWG